MNAIAEHLVACVLFSLATCSVSFLFDLVTLTVLFYVSCHRVKETQTAYFHSSVRQMSRDDGVDQCINPCVYCGTYYRSRLASLVAYLLPT